MGTKVKNETRKPVTMTAADHRRRIIQMVSSMDNTKFLKFIFDFTYMFYLDAEELPDNLPEAERREMEIHRMVTRIRNLRYLKIIQGFVYRLFLKPDSTEEGVQA